MQQLIFSHQKNIVSAFAYNQQSMILISVQGVHFFQLSSLKQKLFKQFTAPHNKISPIAVVRSKYNPNVFVIQGKMGICLVYQIHTQDLLNISIELLEEFKSNMIGFTKIQSILLTQTQPAAEKIHSRRQFLEQQAPINKQCQKNQSLLGMALQKRIRQVQNKQEKNIQTLNQIIVIIDQENKQFVVRELPTCNKIKSYKLIQKQKSMILESMSCYCLSPYVSDNLSFGMFIGQQGCKLTYLGFPKNQEEPQISKSLTLPTKQDPKIILAISLIKNEKNHEKQIEFIAVSIRKQPKLFIVSSQSCLNDSKEPLITLLRQIQLEIPKTVNILIHNIIVQQNRIAISIGNTILIGEIFKHKSKKQLISNQQISSQKKLLEFTKKCQLKQSKTICSLTAFNSNQQSGKMNIILAGCTQQKQFVYIQF